MKKTAVILMNMGGPKDSAGVKPFLYSLFSDPDIFKIPVGQKFFARGISSLRAKGSAAKYALIGGGSPINYWTEIQRSLLENALSENGLDIKVFTAMRYCAPDSAEAVSRISDGSFEKIVLLPLYPQFSYATTVSSFNEWKRKSEGLKTEQIFIDNYYLNTYYITAVAEKIKQAAEFNNVKLGNDSVLIFSAHSTPVKMQVKGDPYSGQIEATAKAVAAAAGIDEYRLSYQSKVGPVKWLEPSTGSVIEELAGKGIKTIIAVPVSFVSDHLETLYDLGILYRKLAADKGIKNFIVTEGLNDSEFFIRALKEEVLTRL